MIIKLPFLMSDGLECEVKSVKSLVSDFLAEDFIDQFPSPEDYYSSYPNNLLWLEFVSCINIISNIKSVVEIGPGRGETSVYLSHKGYSVTVIEPSIDFCHIIEKVSTYYNLDITIYNCSAEYIKNIVEKYDLVIFNASLHHCDDPEIALKNCFNLLNNNGKIIIVNEPIIPFFKRKEVILKKIKNNPEKYGDYGGNEHFYKFNDYTKMLKNAGFTNIVSCNSITYNYLSESINIDPNKSQFKRLLKTYYFALLKLLDNIEVVGGVILNVLRRLSLVKTYFIASKNN